MLLENVFVASSKFTGSLSTVWDENVGGIGEFASYLLHIDVEVPNIE